MGGGAKSSDAAPSLQQEHNIDGHDADDTGDMQQSSNPFPADFPGRSRRVSPCMGFSVLLVITLLVILVSSSAKPLYSLLCGILALLPASLVAKFVFQNFKDEAVSSELLLRQFVIGAIPLALSVVFVESLVGLVLLFALFADDLSDIRGVLQADLTNSTSPTNGTAISNTTTPVNTTTSAARQYLAKPIPDNLREMAPMWKLILFLILVSFVVAALVEEVGKWIVARRYRKVDSDPQNVEKGIKIGCRGILALCSMGALGFATMENIGYVLSFSTTNKSGFPFELVGMGLLRGLLAFPVHVGAQFYVGVAAAQHYIFRDHSSVLVALFVAMIFHGCFDAVALVIVFLVKAKILGEWSVSIVLAVQVLLVVLLLLLCRGRYKALLERERLVLSSETAV